MAVWLEVNVVAAVGGKGGGGGGVGGGESDGHNDGGGGGRLAHDVRDESHRHRADDGSQIAVSIFVYAAQAPPQQVDDIRCHSKRVYLRAVG